MASNINDLKTKRSAAKRKFTTVYSQVLPLLKLTGGNANAGELLIKLDKCWEVLETAHENYAALLEEDAANMQAAGESEEKILTYYQENHDKMLTIKSLTRVLKLRTKFSKAYEEFDFNHRVIKKIIDKIKDRTTDELSVDKNSDIIKTDLDEQVPALEKLHKSLVLDTLKPFKEACTAAELNFQAELNLLSFPGEDNLETEVELIRTTYCKLKVTKTQTRNESATLPISSVSTPVSSLLAPVKLAKVESIKFTGEYRDFAHFKKTFQTIVYPNRDPVEIGLRLLEAVPEKYRHLIDNVDPKEYTKIMDKLEERFGKARHIVSSCTNEITRLSRPTSDEEFITFVEKLEKIKIRFRSCKSGGQTKS